MALDRRMLLLPLALSFFEGAVMVSVVPVGSFISTPGGNALFLCWYQPTNDRTLADIQWFVNGTRVGENHGPRNVTAMGRTLIFENIPLVYNMTRIWCAVTEMNATSSSLLLLQGVLSPVGSLNLTSAPSNISLSWTEPFTLDIAGVDSDITGYCVDVMVIDKVSSLTHFSNCSINNTGFQYTLPTDRGCHESYLFIVAPINIVGIGLSANISYSQELIAQTFEDIISKPWPAIGQASLIFSIIMSAPVCEMRLFLVDFDTEDSIMIGNTNIIIIENIATFSSQQLMTNRRYNVTISASNIDGLTTASTKISMHDVLNTKTIFTRNCLTLYTMYSEHSTASGALFSFVFITGSGDVDFRRSFLLALDRNTSHNHTLPFDLYPGHYRVYAYDIEHDETLHNGVGYPAVTEDLFVNVTNNGNGLQDNTCCLRTNERYLKPFNCTLTSSFGLIWALCNQSSSLFAAGIQVIVQSTNVSEVQKLYVNQSNDLHTPVTVSVERDGEYQVFIFAIRKGIGILASTPPYVMVYYDNTTIILDDTSFYTFSQSDPTATMTSGTIHMTRGILIVPFIAIGAVVAVLVATILVIIVVLVVVCCIPRYCKHQSSNLVELNTYCTTEELQKEDGAAVAFTTLSPADISAGYSVVTGNIHDDVAGFSIPCQLENLNVGEQDQAEGTTLPTATYSSLSHSLKPKLGENANGHYMLLNHPTRSNLAKGSQLVGQDLSSYSSLGESRNKQLLSIREESNSKEGKFPDNGQATGVYSLLNPSGQDRFAPQDIEKSYATVGGLVDKQQEDKGVATKKAGSDVAQQGDPLKLYATVDLAAKKDRRLNKQMPMYKTLDLETSSSGEVTGVGDSDNVLRPHKQHSGSPSKDNPSVTDDNCMKDSANYQDIPYEFVATSPPGVMSSAGVLGDFNRVVYSDLRTDSSDTTARKTTHNAAIIQDHVAGGGGSSVEKEGKPKYCEVTLLEDSTIKDVPILNGHGVEYSTVTGTQNKHNIHYAFVDPVPSSTEAPAPLGDTNKVVYSAVRPHDGSLGKSEERCNDTTSATNAHSYAEVDLSKKRNKKKPKSASGNKSTAQD